MSLCTTGRNRFKRKDKDTVPASGPRERSLREYLLTLIRFRTETWFKVIQVGQSEFLRAKRLLCCALQLLRSNFLRISGSRKITGIGQHPRVTGAGREATDDLDGGVCGQRSRPLFSYQLCIRERILRQFDG